MVAHDGHDSTAVRVAWILIACWVLVTLGTLFAPERVSFNMARYINVWLMSAFTLAHGSRRYGWSGIIVYFVLAVVVTNAFENMSIATGFPFGEYRHTAAMGPQLADVPIIVGPIFAVAGYLGWVLAAAPPAGCYPCAAMRSASV